MHGIINKTSVKELKAMKTVLITGGSRGIGAACVRLFSKNDFRVYFTYHTSEQHAFALCRETGAAAICADVAVPADIQRLAQCGPIDILVNNAGIAEQKLFSDITLSDWDRMFDVNVKGMFLVTQAFLPNMIHNKYGKIINLSSIWGQCGASCEVHYSASKAAVIGFTKALAKELGLSGICVNCVAPGIIDTDMNTHLSSEDLDALNAEIPLNRMGTPEEVANVIYFLASEQADYITGQIIAPNGGWEL